MALFLQVPTAKFKQAIATRMTTYSIPLYQPDLSGNEKRYVLECLDSTWISSKGTFISAFENRFAAYVGARHAVGVCNGTVALHLALITLGIGPGDEVIVPTFTYIAAVNAIAYTGATPVFVDSRRDNWQMDSTDVRRKISARTKALMVVHLYGHPCEMDALKEIAREHRLFVVEDCAEAFGARYKGRLVGTFGDIATFSFYGNKTITTGEGGMVVTNDQALAESAKHFKGQGLAPNREYWHDVIGYNYRMTNICAAIGLAQLERADEFLSKKRELAKTYQKYLQGLPVEMHGESADVTHSYWMTSILIENPADRDGLRAHLRERGIETRPLFYPVHMMPMYVAGHQTYPVAQDLAERGINLPSWPGLGASQAEAIASAIEGYFGKPSPVGRA
jgi:perosamine synthetase